MALVVADDLTSTSTESTWCKIIVDEKEYLYVGASYKSADQAEVDEILMVIKQASDNHIAIVDFNYSAINLENVEAVNK